MKKPEWEEYYDSIGLSPGERFMRLVAKQRARAAATVREVADLLSGTYFDAHFCSEDGVRSWGYFDPKDFSVQPMTPTGDGAWKDSGEERIALDPDARVRYVSSGEDLHGFVLLDPPG